MSKIPSSHFKLFNDDCLNVIRTIPDKSVDLIVSDLPYGITRNKWDSVIPLTEIFASFKRVIKNNGAIVLFAAMPFTADLVMAGKDIFKYSMVWKKK